MDETQKNAGTGAHAEALVDGILADADAEAARITAEAQAYAAASIARAEEQARTILRESAAKADAQVAAIKADAEAKIAIERRKRVLRMQENMARDVVERAARKLSAMVGTPDYRNILRGWIAEAAVGLSAAAASVNASMDELGLIDDTLLRAAEADVLAATGKATSLRLLKGDPSIGQGVYLLADGGKLAYDNRVATRLERRRTEIRKLIYKALFDESKRA
jgi:vacuolar-type H+-ATPase subunit E/Vma4